MLRRQVLAIALFVGLVSTACRSSGSPLQGDAVLVAAQQSGQFCDEAYSEVWGDFASDALRPDNAQDFAISIQKILTTIPDDAPRDLRRVYETFEEIAVLSIDLPVVDVADMDDETRGRYEDIVAALDELDGFDQDIVSSYVASTCPGQYARRGFLTTGTAGEPGDSSTDSNETAAAQVPSPTAVPTPEPTPIPVSTTELELTSNIGRYDGVDIELLDAQATNATPESLLAGQPLADPEGQNWLIVRVGLTNTYVDNVSFQDGAFRLLGTDGRPIIEAQRLDDRGRSDGYSAIGSREFVESHLAFPTGDLVTDLGDWVVVIDQADGVPEVIPFVAPYANPYPIELEVGGTGNIAQALDDEGRCTAPIGTWEVDVTEAVVTVDPLEGVGERASSGERWVTARLFATNNGPVSDDFHCSTQSQFGFNMDLRLAVDGRSTSTIGEFDYGLREIAPGESGTMEAVFVVDAEATTLALITGPDNEVIVEWQVEIPLILDR